MLENIKVMLGLIILAAIPFAVYGYVVNIVKLFHMVFAGHEGEFILRIVGIFTGVIGAVAGYI